MDALGHALAGGLTQRRWREVVRHTVLCWLHRVALHVYAAAYIWGSFDGHFRVVSVYYCGLALVTASFLATPFCRGSAHSRKLRLVVAGCAVTPLASTGLLWAVCHVFSGLEASCWIGASSPLPALAGGISLAHHWCLERYAPALPLPPAQPVGSGRAWRFCPLLVACATLDYNAYGAIYFAAFLAITVTLSSRSLQDAIRLAGSLDSFRRALSLSAVWHIVIVCASYWLLGGRGVEVGGWWTTLLVIPETLRQRAQCFCALMLLGELQCDAAGEAELRDLQDDNSDSGRADEHLPSQLETAGFVSIDIGNVPVQLLKAFALGCWVLIWPAMPSVPLLLTAFWIMWQPQQQLSYGISLAVTRYAAFLSLACYAFSIHPARQGWIKHWVALTGIDNASASLCALALLTMMLAYCTRRSELCERDMVERRVTGTDSLLGAIWQRWAVRALFVLRVITVSTILSLGISRQDLHDNSSLVKMGYLGLFIVLLHGSPLSVEAHGWDVLRGRRAVWRGLLVYSSAVTLSLLLWRALALPDLHMVGFVRADRYFTQLLPHMAVATLASVQKYALKQSWASTAFFLQMSTSAHFLLKFGVFAQMSVLLLAVMLPPASIDSFILLTLFVAIMTVAQISMRRRLLLPLLGLITNIACFLLLLRCMIMLPLVQAELARLLDPELYPLTWKSLALHTAHVAPWTQYLLATLLLLSRAFGSTIKLALVLLDEETQFIGFSTGHAHLLHAAQAWLPWGLLVFTYVVMLCYPIHFFSSLTVLVVLFILLTGRGSDHAGTIISACMSVALLAQYLSCFGFVQIPDRHAQLWGFFWSKTQVCTELALILLSIMQRVVHYEATTEKNAVASAAARIHADGGAPAVLSKDIRQPRILAYDVQVGAVAVLLLALLRSSVWSVAKALVVGAFLSSADSPKELSTARARVWLVAMASAIMLGLVWQNVICVWIHIWSGHRYHILVWASCKFYEQAPIPRRLDGWICSPYLSPDCQTQISRCQDSWIAWWELSTAAALQEFVVFLGLCFLCRAGPLLAKTTGMEAGAPRHQSLSDNGPVPADGPSLAEAPAQSDQQSSEHVAEHAKGLEEAPGGGAVVALHSSGGYADLATAHVQEVPPEDAVADRPTHNVSRTLLICASVVGTLLAMIGAFLLQAESNAIAIGYLWLVFLKVSAIYDFTIDRDPIAAHLRMVRVIGTFNFVAVAASLLFQCPALPCPYTMKLRGYTSKEDRTAFLSIQQCERIQANMQFRGSHPWGGLIGCLGLMKTSRPLLQGDFAAWNLLICGGCLIEGICIVRWQSELMHHLEKHREFLHFRAEWYMKQHKQDRQFQLSIWDTKRQVLLAKLSRLTAHLDAIRAIWDGQRAAFTEREEKESQWATRVENLCLKSGVKRSRVELLLRQFSEAASFGCPSDMDAKNKRLMYIAVDRLLLEYLHQHRLCVLRMITYEEEEAAKSKLLEECRALDAGLVNQAPLRARRPSEVYNDVSCTLPQQPQQQPGTSFLAEEPQSANPRKRSQSRHVAIAEGEKAVELVEVPRLESGTTDEGHAVECVEKPGRKSSTTDEGHGSDVEEAAAATGGAQAAVGAEKAAGFTRTACYDLIDDFLFIESQDKTQFEHRRRSSILHLIMKVVCSQVTPLLICATMLQFLEYRSVPAAISVAGVSLSLCVYPHVPWRAWTLLYQWNSAIFFAKILFQLPLFCEDGSLHISDQDCQPPTNVPWTAVFGLMKTSASSGKCGSSDGQTLGSLLWADLLVCAMVLINMSAALESGRCNQVRDLRDDLHREDSPPSGLADASAMLPAHSAGSEGSTFDRRPTLFNAMPVEWITRIHFMVWKIIMRIVEPESSLTYEHFVSTSTKRRPSKDLYALRFTIILILLGLLIFNWQAMSGEGRSLNEALSSNHFSGWQVFVLILFMLLIVSDRILYTWYRSDLSSEGEGVAPPDGGTEDASVLAGGSWATAGAGGGRGAAPGLPQLRILVRTLHQALLVTHILIIHFVFMLRWTSLSLDTCVVVSLLRAGKGKLILFYALYMLYIVLSSLQLRYDVHIVRGGMRFTKSTDFLTKMCFRVYSALPFLHELRVLTDWTATVTSLDFFMWMKLEDAQHNLYRVRGDMESRALIPPGQKRPAFEKLYLGGLLLFLLLTLLIGPILYFSSLNSLTRNPNPVVFGELSAILEISPMGVQTNPWVRSLMLYKAQAQSIEDVATRLKGETVQQVIFPTSSDSFWMISPSARESMARLLKEQDIKAKVVLAYVFDRQATAVKATGRDESEYLNIDTIQQFAEVLSLKKPDAGDEVISVNNTFWHSKRLTSGPKANNLYGNRDGNEGDSERGSEGDSVQLRIVGMEQGGLPHWSLTKGDAASPVSCTLTSDDIASNGSSVHSLYVGVVLTIGNFLRLIFKDSSKRVIYEEVPDTDLLLDLCDGIYIARIQGDLDAEYKLYYELIRVFRSPELLARISQPKARREAPSRTADAEPLARPRLRRARAADDLAPARRRSSSH